MDGRKPLSVFTHRENFQALKAGETCLVRWESDGKNLWYHCTILEVTATGCVVYHRTNVYEISWEYDEVLTNPPHTAVQYVTMYPEAVCIEVGNTKYLVPSGELSLGETMDSINTLRQHHKEQATYTDAKWKGVTIDSVASRTLLQKVVFVTQ